MRRRTFDLLLTLVGALLTLVLLVAGGLLTWAYTFANNAYAFWQLGQIALYAAIAAFVAALVMLVLTFLGWRHLRRVNPEQEVFVPPAS